MTNKISTHLFNVMHDHAVVISDDAAVILRLIFPRRDGHERAVTAVTEPGVVGQHLCSRWEAS